MVNNNQVLNSLYLKKHLAIKKVLVKKLKQKIKKLSQKFFIQELKQKKLGQKSGQKIK